MDFFVRPCYNEYVCKVFQFLIVDGAKNMYEQIIQIQHIEHIIALFGSFVENMKLLEKEYGVTILNRGEEIKLSGEARLCSASKKGS